MSVASSTVAVAPVRSPMATWRVILVGVIALLLLLGQLYIVLPMLDQIGALPGASTEAAPSALTAFAMPYAIGFLLLGPLSDRLDPRAVMAVSLTMALLATLGAGLAPTWGWFLFARVIQGVSAAPFTPAILLVIAARVHPARRLVATSSVISAGMAAAIFAQVIAQLAISSVGMTGLFIGFAIGLGACLILLLALIPARLPRPEEVAGREQALIEAYRWIPKLLGRPRLLLLLLAAVSYLTVFVGLYSAIQLAGPSGIATDPARLLLVRASATPAMIAIPLLTPFLARYSGRRRLLTAVWIGAVAATALGVCALARLLSLPVFALGMLVVAAAIAVAAPATVTEVMSAAPDAGAAANALYSSAIFGGASLGAPLAASIVGSAGHQAGFGAFALASAGLLAIALVLAAYATRVQRDGTVLGNRRT